MSVKQIYTLVTGQDDTFQRRKAQEQMLQAIDQCFTEVNPKHKSGENICIIEAPTGTGKSLAYLIAGIVNAKKFGKKFVISTATKILQGQLFTKDLPQLIKQSGMSCTFGLAKGRNNYLCPYQLSLSFSELPMDMLTQADKIHDKLQSIADHYQAGKWDGDLDNAPVAIDSKLKSLITIDRHSCLSYQCPHNQKDDSNCPFYKNRENLRKCEVIITNHSLLITDISNPEANILPVRPNEYFLCIDEAHNLPSYAINNLTGQFELKVTISLINNLGKLVANASTNSYIVDNIPLCDSAADKAYELTSLLEQLFKILRLNLTNFNGGVMILNDYLNPLINSEIKDLFTILALNAGELLTQLVAIREVLKENIKNNPGRDEINLSRLGFYLANVEIVAVTANNFINHDDSKFNAYARWVNHKLIDNADEFMLITGINYAGNILHNYLWSKVHAVCLTSATLAINENFDYFKVQLGLNPLPNIITKQLESSFNYAANSQLVIPQFRHAPEYTLRAQFENELTAYLGEILDYSDNYGSLVLFFNRQQLLDVFSKLPRKLHKYILLQTDFFGMQKLIAQHKANIDNGQPSIIFGLNSFAQGVDLPSRYCMHVIVTKLPFETHKDPQNMVKEYWIKAENGNFFMESSLPETCIRLIQAVGRLIRTETDYGQITICDNRIATKQYGNIMLKSLPKFNRRYNPQFIQQSLLQLDQHG